MLLCGALREAPRGTRSQPHPCRPPACSEYHERVRSQGQQLQQLQAQLDKLHKEVSSVRAANSEVSPAARGCPAHRTAPCLGPPLSPPRKPPAERRSLGREP